MALDGTLQRPLGTEAQLDGPAPNGNAAPGVSGLSLAGLAPAAQVGGSPEILTGVLAAGRTIDQELDAIAQAFPQAGMEIVVVKMLLQKLLGRVQAAGGQAISPTETGSQFPGGGFASTGL